MKPQPGNVLNKVHGGCELSGSKYGLATAHGMESLGKNAPFSQQKAVQHQRGTREFSVSLGGNGLPDGAGGYPTGRRPTTYIRG